MSKFALRTSTRFFFIRALVVFCFLVLGARLVYVQGMMRTDLQARADRQTSHLKKKDNLRLSILDRNGLPLAETVKVYSCYVDPSQIKNKTRVAKRLSSILGLDTSQLATKMKKKRGSFMWVKRNVPAVLVAKIRSEKMKGVAFKLEYRRHYPMGPIASHVLGLVGVEGHGLSGVEQKYNSYLSRKSEKVGQVQLTIDGWIQQIAEKELDWGAKKTKAKRGSVLIQDPKTGEILAIASWPPMSLDPDDPPPSKELRIPPLSDVYEPGSTFKIVIGAASLEENLMKQNERFSGENGAFQVADIKIHDHEPIKSMNFEEIFVYSSNIGTAKLADRVGSERLYQYARLFGFGVFPGTGLPGETKGTLRHPSRWSGVSKNVISFGQEVGVTSMQLIMAYSTLANKGVLMEPRLFQKVISEEGDVLVENPPMKIRRVVSEKSTKRMNEVLTQVVERGTGRNAQIRWDARIKVAGKTGTAQKFDRSQRRYHQELTLVTFCGFFPADDPKVAMMVVLDEPEGRRWGGTDAAPVFRRIAEQLTNHIFM